MDTATTIDCSTAEPAGTFTPAEPAESTDSVFTDVYQRLKMLASRQRLRSGAPKTLCTTELVHETYLRIGQANYQHHKPAQFFAYAARAMRHILTDAARRRLQPKRGGDQTRLELGDPAVESVHLDATLALQLDQALTSLAREDARAAQVVELHFFAGLDLSQVAEALGVARRTVDRDWRYARAALAAHAEG